MPIFKCEIINENLEIKKGILYINREIYFEEKEIDAEYIATPTFFNAHTHLADSVVLDIPYMNLNDTVSKNGVKFRYLDIFKNKIRDSISFTLKEDVFASGTTLVLDFREGGLKGARDFFEADKLKIGRILARPLSIHEAEIMVKKDWIFGFGFSSTRDYPFSFLEDVRDLARKNRKIFAIHAGEKDSKDVESALSLEPDLLIHMNRASKIFIKKAMDAGIPIVSCPRSNAFFGLLNISNYKLLSEYDKWLIGTDNAMICTPSILDEIKFTSYIVREDRSVLSAVIRGFKMFNLEGNVGIILFSKHRFKRSLNVLSTVVRRCDRKDIVKIVVNRECQKIIYDL